MFIYAIDGIDTIAGIDAIDVLYGYPYEGSQRPSGNGEQPVGEVELVAIEPVFEFEASSRNYSGIYAGIGRCCEPRDDESADEVLVVVGIL